MRPGNDRRTVATFAIVAVLILVMACINFVNLSTARAGQRAREVALRKVVGASRRQLIVQFLSESILVAALAMLIALALVELGLPYLSAWLDAALNLDYLGRDGFLPWVLGLVLVVGAIGGVYPAFILSRFQPSQVLKANKASAETEGSGGCAPARRRPVRHLDRAHRLHRVIYAQTEYVRPSIPATNARA